MIKYFNLRNCFVTPTFTRSISIVAAHSNGIHYAAYNHRINGKIAGGWMPKFIGEICGIMPSYLAIHYAPTS